MTTVLDCPFIDQRIKYPTGCESVSAVMLLRYYGFDITPEEFIDNFLPTAPAPEKRGDKWYGADPQKYYLGNPYTTAGWGCFAAAVRCGIEKYLSTQSSRNFAVREMRGLSLSDLCVRYIDRRIPVIVFATMEMEFPREYLTWTIPDTGEQYTWKTPMHCLLLTGYKSSAYLFNDPLKAKNTPYPAAKSELAHLNMGCQSVVILPDYVK